MYYFCMSIEKKPEDINNPNPEQKFGLKELVTALMLAGTPPALAQPANPYPHSIEQSIQQDEYFREKVKEVRKILKLNAEFYAEHERFAKILGIQAQDSNKRTFFEETEKALDDPQYIKGILKIREYGGNLYEFVGYISPDLVKDHAELESRLSRVPEILRGKIRIVGDDFNDTRKMPNFSREGFKEKALQFFDAGIMLNPHELNGLLDLENDSPGISDAIISLHRRNEHEFKARDIIYILMSKRIRADGLFDEAYIDALIELSKTRIGIFSSTSKDISTDPEKWTQYLERIKDPKFREAFIGFQTIDYISIDDAFKWNPDMYEHPLFLKNIALLKKHGGLKLLDLETHHSNTLKAEGLEEFLYIMSPIIPGMRETVFRFIEETTGDASKWTAVQNLVKKYQYSERALKMIPYLKGARLTDAEYLAVFDEDIQINPNGQDPYYISLGDIDAKFVQRKTHKNISEHIRDLNGYLTTLNNQDTNIVVREILDKFRNAAFTMPILWMNELHDSAPKKRLEVLSTLNADVLFKVMLAGGDEAYLSTFRLLYNGNGYAGPETAHSFINKIRKEYGSLYAYLQTTRPTHEQFDSFINLMSQNNILDQFLSDIGNADQQREILMQFLFDPKNQLSENQAISLSDLLQTSNNESVWSFVLDSLRKIFEDSNANVQSKNIAGLLVAQHFLKATHVPQWAQNFVEANRKYFPNMQTLEGKKAFNVAEEGKATNIQLHFFYDDRGKNRPEQTWDGHHSFRNFIVSLGGTVSWDKTGMIQRITTMEKNTEITDEGDYIVIKKNHPGTKRVILIYANKPDRNDTVVADVQRNLMREKKPHIVVHRGHSYHAKKTIELLEPGAGVELVNLGSCGGIKNISHLLEKISNVQIMGTRAVGTMIVNDRVLRAFDSMLLKNGSVDWSQLRTQLDRDFTRRGGMSLEHWDNYVLPHQNRIAHLIAAIKAKLLDEKKLDIRENVP